MPFLSGDVQQNLHIAPFDQLLFAFLVLSFVNAPDKPAPPLLLITSDGNKTPHTRSPHDLDHFVWRTTMEFSTTEPCMKAFDHRPRNHSEWRKKHEGGKEREREIK